VVYAAVRLSIPHMGIVKRADDRGHYTVPDISCGHCKQAVSFELSQVAGVEAVDVDLDTKLVTVRGNGLDHGALRAAIEAAGYEAA